VYLALFLSIGLSLGLLLAVSAQDGEPIDIPLREWASARDVSKATGAIVIILLSAIGWIGCVASILFLLGDV